MVNPMVFMDITIDGNSAGRIVIELFADTTPNTAERFRVLFTGEKDPDLHYKGSGFKRLVGSIVNRDAVNRFCLCGHVKSDKLESVNGVNLEREKFINKHDGPGTVSMLSPNQSEFFISTDRLTHLDGKYVVFGKVLEGINIVNAIENMFLRSSSEKPPLPVIIADCGELRELTSIFVKFDQLASTSNKQLSSCLKEIMDLNKQFAVDPNDEHIPENEDKLVETAEIFQRNLDVLADLKAKVCALEERQNKLLSFTRTQIPVSKKRKSVLEMISCLSYDDLVNIENVIKKSRSDC